MKLFFVSAFGTFFILFLLLPVTAEQPGQAVGLNSAIKQFHRAISGQTSSSAKIAAMVKQIRPLAEQAGQYGPFLKQEIEKLE